MSRLHNERLMRAVENMLLTVLLGVGLSSCILISIYGQSSLLPSVLISLSVGLLFILAAFTHAGLWVVIVGLLLLIAAGFFRWGPVFPAIQALRSMFLYTDTADVALLPYRQVMAYTVPVITSLLSAIAIACDSMALNILLFLYALMTGGLSAAGNELLFPFALCVLGLILFFARKQTGQGLLGWPLAVACVLLIIAAAVRPPSIVPDPQLNKAAVDLYQTMQDYLPAADTGARAGFTLQTEGYLPLANEQLERLGGPADPSDEPVMEVRTDRMLYLRGIAYNRYTGLTWDDSLSERRYLYADVVQLGQRRNLFDEYLPAADQPARLSGSVHMLSAAPSTLYVPQRIRSLVMRSEHMVPYYNRGSELFVTRELVPGDGYEFTYLHLPADSEQTAALIRQASAVSDVHYEENYRLYTVLPDHIQKEVKELSMIAAGGEEDPYLRALAIRDYLNDRYTYSLDVTEPPNNVDFCAWFLLREKRGYCTYFATALTVLCRLQGLPARYVTGYIAKPENGVATVTRANAHAWTEVYLNGFGWLTLDAAPGHEYREEPDGSPPEETPSDQPPEASPTPEPPFEEPTPEPSVPPYGTPEPETTEQPEPDNPDQPREDSQKRFNPLWLLILLLLIPAAVLILRDPLRRAQRHPNDAPEILGKAMEAALARIYRRRKNDETLQQYWDGAAQQYPDLPIGVLADAYSDWFYGRKQIEPRPLYRAWRELRRGLPLKARIACRFGR